MRSPLAFLKFVAKAALNQVAFGVGGDLVIEVLPEVVKDVWQWWGKGRTEEELRAEVQAVVRLSEPEALDQSLWVVAEEAAGQPEPVRQALTAFLALVPAT